MSAADPRRLRPARWWPLSTACIIASLVVAYYLDVTHRPVTGLGLPPLPGRYVFDGLAPGWWHYVTYAFIHANRPHLIGNLIVLGLGSLCLEWRVGAWRTLLAFVGFTVGVAGLFHLVDSRDIYGVSGAAAAVVCCSAVVWVPATRASYFRFLPLAAAIAYFGYVELLPALQHHATRGWKPHVIGIIVGTVSGATGLVYAARGRRSVHNQQR